MITVEHLRKDFTYYKKMTGLKGSMRNIFHRETLTKEAVRDISFSVEQGEMVGFSGAQRRRKNHNSENTLRHPVSHRR